MKRLVGVLGIAVLSAMYVGSYFALLTTFPAATSSSIFVRYDRKPIYRIDNVVTRAAFRPLLWLDRNIRPQYWSWSENMLDASPREPPRLLRSSDRQLHGPK